MNGICKAKKAIIQYNGIELDGYMTPDGGYWFSKTQAGLTIDKGDYSLQRWLDGNSPEALPYKDFSPLQLGIEGNNATFHGITLEVTAAYWAYWAQKGNTKALALVTTSTVECLTRLFDDAFGVTRTEAERQQMNVQNMDANEALFQVLAMMKAMNERFDAQEARYEEMKEERRVLSEANEELEELKEEIESYPQFLYLLEVAKNELDITDYPNGITCKEYLEQNLIPLDASCWCTLARRTASFYRSTKGRSPERRGSHNIYRSIDVAYIVATLRLIMLGKR